MSEIERGETMDFFDEVYAAMSEGDLAFLKFVAEAYPPFPFGQDTTFTRSWITHAIHACHYTVFDWVLAQRVPVNFCDDEGCGPLKSLLEMERQFPPALSTKDVIAWIDRLIEAGADVNFRHTLDETALHRAAMISSPAVVRHLLDCGADPLAYDAEYAPVQPIHYAKWSKWKNEVTDILQAAMKL
ncbi:hypothetical protein [uncultured Tateyamaria sp.]|uniref:ankyrin repeat domain-containing protein n=1 Tax=uncultured Tateyamaria sp. TaxID=455651 RepID=UPI00261E83D0|nr:hypothetical protein [uncultured Tateyamaria sp.]